jgi:CHAD domain-containing protein
MKRIGLRVGDLSDWDIFVEKFDKFKSFYSNPEYSCVDVLAKLKMCRERLINE